MNALKASTADFRTLWLFKQCLNTAAF